ncbi:MAG: tetratricopeptide repeat protein [Candidatus Rhabdochlamydia sp.]
MSLQKYKDHFILMAEAGFIAINQSDEDAAIKLFTAAELLDPSNPLPRLGMGYLNLCQLKLKQAATIFEGILAEDPSNEMAKTLLGLTLSLNPTELAKGEKTLEESVRKNHDPMIKNLAKSALDFVERFIKKALSPVETKHPKK